MNMKGWKWKAEQDKFERDRVLVSVETPERYALMIALHKDDAYTSAYLKAVVYSIARRAQDEINNLRGYAHDKIFSGSHDSKLQVVGFMNEKQ